MSALSPPGRILDLSRALENESFELRPPSIRYADHAEGARRMAKVFGVASDAVGGGIGNAMEEVVASSHSGTHMDAPYHVGPSVNGNPSRTIDDVPLEWCLGQALVLDVSAGNGQLVDESSLDAAARSQEVDIQAGDIVLLNTGAARYWGSPDFTRRHKGLTSSAVEWLLDRGVRVIGTDANSLDAPHDIMRERHNTDGSPFFEAHWVGRDREFCIIEKLANLDRLPPNRKFFFSALPVKLSRASGAWCRAIAIVGD